jgi:homoserine O-acetyltransferase
MHDLETLLANEGEKQHVIRNMPFNSGQELESACINYVTLGTPQHDLDGQINNAVLLIHGTASNWRMYTEDWWSGHMYGPGQPLDLSRTFVVLSDNIGAGSSSKPSDGMRMEFPSYQHGDVVRAQNDLVTNQLGIQQLRAVIGSSYGGRLAWQWAVQYPHAARGIIPMIASPCALAGRRGMQDYLGIEPLLIDPTWEGGNYQQPPRNFPLAIMAYWIFMSGVNHLWNTAPTRERALRHLPRLAEKIAAKLDANDWIYQLRANDDFNVSLKLEDIQAQVLAIAVDGDEMVPVELGQLEETRQRLGDKMEIVLAKDSGRGHAALQHEIAACAPKMNQFLNALD